MAGYYGFSTYAPNAQAIMDNAELNMLRAENDRLRTLMLDACKVFDHYDLPEHAFHYRRALGHSPKEALNIHKGGEI